MCAIRETALDAFGLATRGRSGAKLMVYFHNRWYPAFAAGREETLT